jgi:hypothetical protein
MMIFMGTSAELANGHFHAIPGSIIFHGRPQTPCPRINRGGRSATSSSIGFQDSTITAKIHATAGFSGPLNAVKAQNPRQLPSANRYNDLQRHTVPQRCANDSFSTCLLDS